MPGSDGARLVSCANSFYFSLIEFKSSICKSFIDYFLVCVYENPIKVYESIDLYISCCSSFLELSVRSTKVVVLYSYIR